ncbi:NUDIX hydrolase [bacterium]|nr:NUDIX hydrolase [bacterium]
MKELPLAVAISVLIKDNQILLIKRLRGDYAGLLGPPGGKIKKNEHLSEAAIREILEESGIESDFKNYLGFVSEHLIENGNILQHFLLHICELEPKTANILNDSEGKLAWFNLDDLQNLKDKVIPSDFLIIEKIVKNRGKGYYNCVLEKNGDNYFLKKIK